MHATRRSFVKGCTATLVMTVPWAAGACTSLGSPDKITQNADSRIKKSIKAGFGGGFSVVSHQQHHHVTHAVIEHASNRYKVVSADLLDWQVVEIV